ncbi:MAG: PSD1 domain-containing protein [Planctomycetaceae bacterium]|nr:PSD1 domain-containing protein [Planctomycetaceae bacterium]
MTVLILGCGLLGGSIVAQDDMMAEQQEGVSSDMDEAAPPDQPKITPEQAAFFESKIRPVLVTNCYSCHSQQSGRSEGGLDVDSAAALLNGGESGPAIDVADFEAGLLWKAINYDGLQMPPQDPLPPHVIEDFRIWLSQGAPDPRVTNVVRGAYRVTPEAIEKGREFWSLQPLPAASSEVVAKVVQTHAADLQATKPIDQFVELQRHLQGVSTPPTADSYTIFRRLCFDLLGVPPTAEQVDWFQGLWAQDPEAAMSTAIDFMLASPKFGERWGRHWLDIVRYAESTGREVNMPYTQAWRYRDYVIDSFNNDKPYDRFLKEQLVGDLLPARNREQKQEQLIATGLLAMGPKTLNERNQRQFEADVIDEQIDVTTRAFLGISVACARCHDHKFEAITQEDYYALAGIFANAVTHFGGANSQRNRYVSKLIDLPIPDSQPAMAPMKPERIAAMQESISQLNEELREVRRSLVQDRRANRRPGSGNNATGNNGNAANGMEQQQRQQMVQRLTAQIGSLQGILDCYDSEGKPRSQCMGVQPKPRPSDVRLLERGEVNQPGATIPRGFVKLLDKSPPKIRRDSSGRMEFANWVANSENPLTARVMANRVWQHLIGEGIVRTPEDFGVTGSRPTHPELLDYLALRLIENKWSIKSLIKEIALSDAYRMGWQVDSLASDKDPENLYLWRSHPQRIQAEALRDTLLWVGGSLDVERPTGSLVAQAGPVEVGRGQQLAQLLIRAATSRSSMESSNSDEMMSESEKPSDNADVRPNRNLRNEGPLMADDNPFRRRDMAALNSVSINETSVNRSFDYRSIYLPVVRELLPRSLELFDAAEPSMVIGVREQSNTAPQALFMMNNELVRQQAVALAERTLEKTGGSSQAIDYVFKTAFSRPAAPDEIRHCEAFIADMTEEFGAAARAREAERATEQERRQRRDARNRRAQRGRDNSTETAPNQTERQSNPTSTEISPELQRQVMIAFCHAILATAEFRYRN